MAEEMRKMAGAGKFGSIKQDGQNVWPVFLNQPSKMDQTEEVIATDMDAESCGPQ
jgi:hypothetical protein